MESKQITIKHIIGRGIRRSEILRVLADFKTYPAHTEIVDRVTVSYDGDERKSEWDVTIDGAPINWVQMEKIDYPALNIRFRVLSGDFDLFNGCWSVDLDQQGAVFVTFEAEYEFGIPIIENLFGPVLKEKLTKNFSGIIDNVTSNSDKLFLDERKEARTAVSGSVWAWLDQCKASIYLHDISQRGCRFYSEKPVVSLQRMKLGDTEFKVASLIKDGTVAGLYRVVFSNPAEVPEIIKLNRHFKPSQGVIDATIIRNSLIAETAGCES